ncbi:SDR family oxidoreductase [Oceanicoccus sp. KOV_DT_Chl]|uniref:SDR family oxidoreductase n=1 Tax=Oceanicoccus sp. KOV_DT_Chl TaxID=1904639 RepID=UPI001358168D|nr:SDR family oxidoreductase [Oceanicoccus sp. KOV_DT_Chl]
MNRIALLCFTLLLSIQVQAATVLVTGANRGIGLEFVKQYAAQGWTVIATSRKPAKSNELNALAKANSNIKVERLDVTDVNDIAELAAKYKGQPIDVLINNAGVLGDYEKQKMGQFDYDELDWVINVNVKGPLRVSEAFLENVKASEQKKIVVLASALGSITMGPFISNMYWYKISKVGMSMAMASMQKDLKDDGITVLRLGPGMVNTRLLAASGAGGKGIEPPESVAGMRDVIAKANPKMGKKSYNYDGKAIPN